MKQQLYKIARQRKSDNQILYLSDGMTRWIDGKSKHKVARLTDSQAEKFIALMKGTPEENIYYYLKALA